MEKYRIFLPVFVILNLALFVDNFSTYLCFSYIPGAYETHPLTSELINKFGLLLGLVIYQVIAAFLLVVVFLMLKTIKHESKLKVAIFILIAAVILIYAYAAAHNLIMLIDLS